MVKNPPAMRQRPGFDPWVGKIPWRRRKLGNPFQYSCLENSHGQRRAGYNPRDCEDSDTTE